MLKQEYSKETTEEEQGTDIWTIDYLQPELCQTIINDFEQKGIWQDCTTVKDVQLRKSKQIWFSESAFKSYQDLLQYEIVKSVERIWNPWKVGFFTRPAIVKYEEEGYYGKHFDAGSKEVNNRCVSIIIYLNDNFEGGETYFDRQKCTIKPKTGQVLMFPSGVSHPHSSIEIKKGTKYVIVGWIGR